MSLNLDKTTWKRVTFGDVVSNVNVSEKDPESAGIDRVIAMEHLDPGELKIQRWGDIADGTTFTRRVKPGQTLFGKRRAYQRKAAFAEFDAICSGDILTFEADETQLLAQFLPFLVQSDGFYDHALGTSAGSLSPRTNWRDLADYVFDLPPLEEQKRLADLLWAIDRHHWSVATQAARLPGAYDAWLSARLSELPTVPLEDVLGLQHGRPVPSALYGTGDFHLLRPGDMRANGTVEWSDSSVQVPSDFAQANEAWILRDGDLVINMTAQTLEDRFLGRVCRMHDEAVLNQRIGRLTPSSDLLPEFAFVALRAAEFASWVAQRSEGSKIKHLHWRHIANYPCPLPTRAEQAEIAHQAHRWTGTADRTEAEAACLRRARSALLDDIFGGQ